MTKERFSGTFEASSSTTWEKAMDEKPWDTLSQNQGSLIVFSARITCRHFIQITCTYNRPGEIPRSLIFGWSEPGMVIFQDILVIPATPAPPEPEQFARKEIAYLFWENEMAYAFHEAGLAYNSKDIQEGARTMAERYQKEKWIPRQLSVELNQIFPETTRLFPWGQGVRKKVFSLSPWERRYLDENIRRDT